MASSASTRPWLWVIEALASFEQVDASILIDLVKRIPEISDDIGRNAREMVSLRILESFIAQQIVSSKGVSSNSDSKIECDPTEHCEDVVRWILHEMSALHQRVDEPEILKWDVESFITCKRASLQKCTLQRLKDAILEGKHPIVASLKERSGLTVSNRSHDNIAVDDGEHTAVAGRIEGSCNGGCTMAGGGLTSLKLESFNGLLQEDSAKSLLTSKRNRSELDLDTEKRLGSSYACRSIDNEGDPHLHNAKKLKQDAVSSGQAVGQHIVPRTGNEPPEDNFTGDGQQIVREGLDFANSSQVGGFGESKFSDGRHDIASKRLEQRSEAVDSGLQHANPHFLCTNRMPQDRSGDGLHQDFRVIEAKGDGSPCAETGTSNVISPDGINKNIGGDVAVDKCEKSKLNSSSGAPVDGSYHIPGEAKDDLEHNFGQETSGNSGRSKGEKIDVAATKHSFLSSNCTFSEDSLSAADLTQPKICMKCNKGGQLLNCRRNTCPLVVHQSCLGFTPTFDDSANFYCPFCAYSNAITEYLEAKKKATLAKKDLAAFIGFGIGQRASKPCQSLILRPEKNGSGQDDNVNRNSQANCRSNYVNELDSSQARETIVSKQQKEPSVSCVNGNLPCGEGGLTANDETLHVFMMDNRAGEKMGAGQPACALEGQPIEAEACFKQASKPFQSIILRPEKNQLRPDENANTNGQANCRSNYVNELDSSQARETTEGKQQKDPSVSCVNENLPCGEGGSTANDRTLNVFMMDNREGEKMGAGRPACALEGQSIEVEACFKQASEPFQSIILRPEKNQLRQDEIVNRNGQANCRSNYVNEFDSSQARETAEGKQQTEPSVSCVNENLPCGEGGSTANDRTLHVLMRDNREGEKMGAGRPASALVGQPIEAQAGFKVGDDSSSCSNAEIVSVNTPKAADGAQKVLRQPTTELFKKAVCQPNADVEASSEEENDKPTSNYFIRFRKEKKQYTYSEIPMLRRKKQAWTAAEEDMLKEGVRRFTSIHDRNIPWKRIFEFGCNVFQKGRTTIDLKDKWRNICKGSPKSN